MSSFVRRLLAISSTVFLLSPALPAFAVDICGQVATPEQERAANNLVATGIVSSANELNCLNVSGLSPSLRSRGCVSSITCAGSPDVQCCAPGTGGREGTAGADGGTAAASLAESNFLRLRLPGCISNGNCQLDDIIKTGVSFANLLFGLSGAVLLATFVYGGVLYLTAGSSGNVSKAKDMLKNALIGMVLVFGAGLLVSVVYDTFRSDAGGGTDACTQQKSGFSCQYLEASPTNPDAIQTEMQRRGCVPRLCAGDDSRRCCPDPALQ
jgi:hypothetical protein